MQLAMSTERETRHANDVVTLSVGGKEFATYFGTLANSRSPYFEYMFQVDRFSGRILINSSNIILDRQDRVFVDRDGELFSHVLNFFRDGKRAVLPEDTNILRRLVREAEFFNLPSLVAILEERLNEEDKRAEEREIKLETVESTLQKISQQLYVSSFRRDLRDNAS
uniref:BTB domain-containing protein n=2 Tax=Plectus sambesii TaxID=2011161 RepID=A0A914V8I2_9BILA